MSTLDVVAHRAAGAVQDWQQSIEVPSWPAVSQRAARRARTVWTVSIAAVLLVVLGVVAAATVRQGRLRIASPDQDYRSALAMRALEMVHRDAAGDFRTRPGEFTDNYLSMFNPAVSTQASWAQLLAAEGRFSAAGAPTTLLTDDGGFVEVPLRFAHGAGVARYWFDRDRKITKVFALAAVAVLDPARVDADIRAKASDALGAELAGDYDRLAGQFNDLVRAQITTEKLRADDQSVTGPLGAERERAGTQFASYQGATIATTLVGYQHGVVMYRFAYDASHRITGLFILNPAAIG